MKSKKNINKKIISFLILIFSLSLFMLLFYNKESDYFWHIKAGEYMFKNGILKKDVFSWYVSNKYWMSHEWLFEICIYILKRIFGVGHLLGYCFVSILSLLLILFFSNKENYIKNTLFSLIWLVFSLIFMYFVQVRPHLISFNFLALTVWFLYDLYKNEESKKIYFLPLIAIIWANVHGGSSNLSYLMCLLFFISGLFSFDKGKIVATRYSKKQLKKYLLVAVLCMIGVCINIHGIKMFFYPYVNILDKTMINSISEWRITSINEISHYPYFLLLLVIIIVLLCSKKKITMTDLLLCGFSCVMGLKGIRFWAYTYIIMNYVIFNYVDNRKNDKYSNLSILIVCGMFLLMFFSKIGSIKLNNNLVSREVVQIIKKEKPKKLFNMYGYGGELIYNNIKVFIDGRADLYSKYNYKDYLDISELRGDYVKLINKYNFDYFLVDNKYPINTYLKYDSNYEKIYKDKKLSLYKIKKVK